MNNVVELRKYKLSANVVVLMSRFVRHVRRGGHGEIRLHDKDVIVKMAEIVHNSQDETLSKLFNEIVAKLGVAPKLDNCA